jgi:predicted short-subunit dehydrogenase-like oxidoreductase (DUF2520 family)
MSSTSRLLIVGAGKVGTNLARLAQSQGHTVTLWNPQPLPIDVQGALEGSPIALVQKREATGPFDLVLLAVSDGAQADVADLVDRWSSTSEVPMAHTSGSLGPIELKSGRVVGVCHPAFAFPTPNITLERLQTAAFLIDGPDTTRTAFVNLIDSWGTTAVEAPGADRDLYHAACVTASNFLSLVGANASDLLTASGVPEAGQSPLLHSLMGSVLAHAKEKSFTHAMTGPAARGDAPTLIAEATRIAQKAPEQFNLFLEANLALLQRHGHTAATDELMAWLDDMDGEE